MTTKTRRMLWLVALLAIVTVPVDLLFVRAVAYPTVSTRASHWAQGLSVSETEAAISELANLPVAYRRALFARLAWNLRVRVVESVFGDYGRSHQLTTEQSTLLTEILEALRAYAPGEEGRFSDFFERARSLFNEQTATDLLMTFGPSDSTELKEPFVNRLAGWISDTIAVEADTLSCECNVEDDVQFSWCQDVGDDYFCHADGCAVSYWHETSQMWIPGCGLFLLFQCDGTCYRLEPNGLSQ